MYRFRSVRQRITLFLTSRLLEKKRYAERIEYITRQHPRRHGHHYREKGRASDLRWYRDVRRLVAVLYMVHLGAPLRRCQLASTPIGVQVRLFPLLLVGDSRAQNGGVIRFSQLRT